MRNVVGSVDLLATFLVLGSLSLVPSFVLMGALGWIGELKAAGVISVAPLVGLLLIGSRHFSASIAGGALKG